MAIAQGRVGLSSEKVPPGGVAILRVDEFGQVVLSKEDIDRIAEAVFGRVKALLAEGVKLKTYQEER